MMAIPPNEGSIPKTKEKKLFTYLKVATNDLNSRDRKKRFYRSIFNSELCFDLRRP